MSPSGLLPFNKYRTELAQLPIAEALITRGLATFQCNATRDELISVAKSLGEIHFHRDSDEDGITVLEPRIGVQPAGGFTTSDLFPHTDSSGKQRPPDFIVFYCEEPAESGGESLFVDGQELYSDLRDNDPELASMLSHAGSAVFWSPSGYSAMPILSLCEGERYSFRFRLDDRVYFSKQLACRLTALIQLIEGHTKRVSLSAGQGFVLNNGWWLHGRTKFTGHRRCIRLLIDSEAQYVASTRLGRGFDKA